MKYRKKNRIYLKDLKRTPWYLKPILCFMKPKIARTQYADGWVEDVHFVNLFDTTHIVKINRHIPPPEHFNCRCAPTVFMDELTEDFFS